MIQSPINWLSVVSGEVFHRERGSCQNMADSKKMPTGAQVCSLFFKSHYIGVLKNAFRHSGQKNITDRVPGTGVNIIVMIHKILVDYSGFPET